MKRIMQRTLVLIVMGGVTLAAHAFATYGTWTGATQVRTGPDYRQTIWCEYQYSGGFTWRPSQGGACLTQVRIN